MRRIVFTLLCLSPLLASAHTAGAGGGFGSGFTHPAMGLDHLLAMITVGLLSARIGGRAIWTVPATFVGVMILGGLTGMAVPGFPFVETGILYSVLLLGGALAASGIPVGILMGAVAFFAFFHGVAHGGEMPATATPVLFAAGFALGTAVLHLFGVLTGRLLLEFRHGHAGLRILGLGIAGFGLRMLIA